MLLFLLAGLANATTVTVCDSGCDQTSLASALAVTGVTRVELDDRTYTGPLVLGFDVEIVGTSSAPATLQCVSDTYNQIDITGAYTILFENVHIRACDTRRAIKVAANAELTLDHVEVFGTTVESSFSGGVIQASANTDVTLHHTILHPTLTVGYGAHIQMLNGSGRLEIHDSELRGGDSNQSGGCIFSGARYMDIRRSTLEGCRSSAKGGAIFADSNNLQFVFEGNRFIDNESFVQGGHIHYRGGTPSGQTNTFEAYDNLFCQTSASQGGALWVGRSWDKTEIRGNRFMDLHLPGRVGGAAIHLEYTGGSAAQHPMIVNNHFLETRAHPIQNQMGASIQFGPNANYTEIVNNLFARNGQSSSLTVGSTISNWNGANTEVRHNLLWNNDGTFLHGTLTHDDPVPSANPLLQGGSTWTGDCDRDLRPGVGSPLLGAGDAAIGVPNVGAYPYFDPTDADGDGFTSEASGGDDCNDEDDTVNPGVTEVCDGVDNDCSGQIDGHDAQEAVSFWLDADGDSHGDPASEFVACAPQANTVDNGDDCNDASDQALPGGTEVCDGLDNDCNGLTDDEDAPVDPSTWYADTDEDGHGDAAVAVSACNAPAGYVSSNDDCDDDEPLSHPDRVEVCDTIDNDCDGDADSDAVDRPSWFADTDTDSFGDATVEVVTCEAPDGYTADDTDCDDDDPLTYPAASELCDGVDNDCEGDVDEDVEFVDWFADTDSDGFGDPATADNRCDDPGTGWVTEGTDCNDSDATIAPGRDEVCDGIDQDCSGSADDTLTFQDWSVDSDGDGFGDASTTESRCDDPGDGWVLDATDCDDAEPTTFPGASEQCDGIDQDCNGLIDDALVFHDWYPDEDGDGFGAPEGSQVDCISPGEAWSLFGSDCDDSAAAIHPDAPEICNELDDNCDGRIDEHATEEIWYDGIDQDCDGNDTDQDGDGVDSIVVGGEDCDDEDPAVHPLATELVDEVDNNCDGEVLVYAVGGSGTCSQAPAHPGAYLTLLLALLLPRRSARGSIGC